MDVFHVVGTLLGLAVGLFVCCALAMLVAPFLLRTFPLLIGMTLGTYVFLNVNDNVGALILIGGFVGEVYWLFSGASARLANRLAEIWKSSLRHE